MDFRTDKHSASLLWFTRGCYIFSIALPLNTMVPALVQHASQGEVELGNRCCLPSKEMSFTGSRDICAAILARFRVSSDPVKSGTREKKERGAASININIGSGL